MQDLSERTKKIILWSVVIVLGAGLLIWWFRGVAEKIRSFQGEPIQEQLLGPDIKDNLHDLPDLEFPSLEIPQETFEEILK